MGMNKDMQAMGAEFFGVMIVVLVGASTGSAMLTGITLGLMMTMAMAVSAGHLNPAITLAQMALQKMEPEDGLKYIAAQLAGAAGGFLIYMHVLSEDLVKTSGFAADGIWLTLSGLLVVMMIYTLVWIATVGTGMVEGHGGLGVGVIFWLLMESLESTNNLSMADGMNAAIHLMQDILGGTVEPGTFWLVWLGTFLGALVAFWVWDEFMGDDDDEE
jgi:glycerol uptake facilitator protein